MGFAPLLGQLPAAHQCRRVGFAPDSPRFGVPGEESAARWAKVALATLRSEIVLPVGDAAATQGAEPRDDQAPWPDSRGPSAPSLDDCRHRVDRHIVIVLSIGIRPRQTDRDS